MSYKLIAALETLDEQPSEDFPAGRFIMNKADHQGRSQEFILRLNGQKEEVIKTIQPEELPPIGNCTIS